MRIDSAVLVPLLTEFSKLSANQQRIFMFCLVNLPRPVMYSSDVRNLSVALGYHVRTIQKALHVISASPILGQCVQFTRFNHKEEYYYAEREKQEQNTILSQRDL